MMRYELVDKIVNSSKFWQVEHPFKGDDKQFRTTWGRIGGKGQTEVAKYRTSEEAKKKLASKIRDKERKGYVLVKGDKTKAKEAAHGPGRLAKGIKAGGRFSVQLLQPWDGETVPKHAVTEPKLDGERAIMVFSGDRFCCFSRAGNQVNNVTHIAAELYRAFDGYVLDGEIIVGDRWERTGVLRADERDSLGEAIKALRDGKSLHGHPFFAVFDCLTHEELDNRTCRRSLAERRRLLEKLWPRQTVFSGILVQEPVSTPVDVRRMMNAYRAAGAEGAVLKDLDSPYTFRRSKEWTKVKKRETFDYRITRLEEGSGKYLGTLGKIFVKAKGRESGVGTGMTNAERDDMWKRRKSLVGKFVEVTHHGFNENGGLREASFVRLRLDK